MADEISPTGVWIDAKTGQVVTAAPEEGRLLVSPGGLITPDVRDSIDRAKEAAPVTAPSVPAEEPEEEGDSKAHASKRSR